MWERIYLVGAWEQPLVPYWRRGSFTPKSISEQVKPIKVPRRRGNVLYNRSSQFTVPRRGSPSWTLRPRLSRSSPPRASLLLSLSSSSLHVHPFLFSALPSPPVLLLLPFYLACFRSLSCISPLVSLPSLSYLISLSPLPLPSPIPLSFLLHFPPFLFALSVPSLLGLSLSFLYPLPPSLSRHFVLLADSAHNE